MLLFSDEATFHTCDHVNRPNCRICADKQPNAVYEWQRDSSNVNVWMEVTKTVVLQQDLPELYGSSRRFWAPRCPDLTLLDFSAVSAEIIPATLEVFRSAQRRWKQWLELQGLTHLF